MWPLLVLRGVHVPHHGQQGVFEDFDEVMFLFSNSSLHFRTACTLNDLFPAAAESKWLVYLVASPPWNERTNATSMHILQSKVQLRYDHGFTRYESRRKMENADCDSRAIGFSRRSWDSRCFNQNGIIHLVRIIHLWQRKTKRLSRIGRIPYR